MAVDAARRSVEAQAASHIVAQERLIKQLQSELQTTESLNARLTSHQQAMLDDHKVSKI